MVGKTIVNIREVITPKEKRRNNNNRDKGESGVSLESAQITVSVWSVV